MKNVLYLALVIVIGAGAYILVTREKPFPVVPDTGMQVTTLVPMELCFATYGPVQESGIADTHTLRILLDGTKVTGELKFLPAEKDSKVGLFTGEVSSVDPYMMGRTVTAIWDTFAEGMNTKEELSIIFGEGTASIGFGPMVDRGDGVYIYKDTNKLTYGENMTDVACNDLDDRSTVEKYIRENIKTITPEKAVLGGSWYVTRIEINPSKKTGAAAYEDGHIVGKISFSYLRDGEEVTLSYIKVIK